MPTEDTPADRVILPSLETPTLTKAELAELLFERLGLNKRESKDMVEAYFEIIHDTLRCSHVEELLGPLQQWYIQKLASGDPVRGQRLFDRDVLRLMRLQDVEQHLKRLDDEIRAANQRALTYLEYKARAPRSFDALLAKALEHNRLGTCRR